MAQHETHEPKQSSIFQPIYVSDRPKNKVSFETNNPVSVFTFDFI